MSDGAAQELALLPHDIEENDRVEASCARFENRSAVIPEARLFMML